MIPRPTNHNIISILNGGTLTFHSEILLPRKAAINKEFSVLFNASECCEFSTSPAKVKSSFQQNKQPENTKLIDNKSDQPKNVIKYDSKFKCNGQKGNLPDIL